MGERVVRSGSGMVGAALALFALGTLVPFLFTDLPPMTDLPGHMGRWHVMLARDGSEWLQRYYSFEWRVVGNLGVDAVVRGIGPALGVERAAWWAAALIAPLTVAGVAAASRAVHGRIGPGAALACCFVLANPLLYGFVNYCLSVALALLAFAAWVALRGRSAAIHLLATVPLVLLVWAAHAMGWVVLAALVAGWEGERLWPRRAGPGPALADAAVRGLAFVAPALLTLLWSGEATGALFAYGPNLLTGKVLIWGQMLRGGAPWIDVPTILFVAAAVAGAWWRGRIAFDRRLGVGAALLVVLTLAMPRTLVGSWGADERLVPAAMVAILLATRWTGSRRGAAALVAAALALFAVRTAVIAREWRRQDAAFAQHLRALELVPRGARVHALALRDGCGDARGQRAYTHLASMALVRRDALVNNNWAVPDGPLLRVREPVPADQRADPSQVLDLPTCGGPTRFAPLAKRIGELSPRHWDYLWVLRTGGARDPWPGRTPLYVDGQTALYRLE